MPSVSNTWRSAAALALMVSTLFVSGCLSRRPVPTNDVRPMQNASFQIVDQRPDDERTTRWLSNSPYSCAYTVRQVGDEALAPDRLTLLTASLNSRLHARLTGKTLFVTHFGIYINSSQRSRASTMIRGEALAQSLTDYALGSRLERLCRAEELAEGWLETDDAGANRPVVIAQITLTLAGRTHRARGFFTADQQISTSARNPRTAAAISSAVEQATTRLIAELQVGSTMTRAPAGGLPSD